MLRLQTCFPVSSHPIVIEFAHDGSLYATASRDGTLDVYRANSDGHFPTSRPSTTLLLPEYGCKRFTFIPNTHHILLAPAGRSACDILLVDIDTAKLLSGIHFRDSVDSTKPTSPPSALCTIGSSLFGLQLSHNDFCLFDITSQKQVGSLPDIRHVIGCASSSGTDPIGLTLCTPKVVIRYDLRQFQQGPCWTMDPEQLGGHPIGMCRRLNLKEAALVTTSNGRIWEVNAEGGSGLVNRGDGGEIVRAGAASLKALNISPLATAQYVMTTDDYDESMAICGTEQGRLVCIDTSFDKRAVTCVSNIPEWTHPIECIATHPTLSLIASTDKQSLALWTMYH